MYRSGFGDVWKGRCRDQDVAVKVIEAHPNIELQKMINVGFYLYPISVRCALATAFVQRFCKVAMIWGLLRRPKILSPIGISMSGARFAMISDWMVNGNVVQLSRRIQT